MSNDTETPSGDYDVDTVANPNHDVDTPSGTRYVAPQPLTYADKVTLVVASFFSSVTIIGLIIMMILYW